MPATAEKNYSPPALFAGLMLLAAWLPVPLGSNRPWSWELMHAGGMVLLGFWCLGMLTTPRPLPATLKRERLAIALLSLWAIYVACQSLPLPAGVVEVLNPAAYQHQLHAFSKAQTGAFSLSLDRGASLSEFQKITAYLALFVLTLALVTNRRRLRIALTVLVIIGTLQALYGIVLYLSADRIALWNPGDNRDAVSGTYINRNHFAGLMAMCIAAAAGLILAESGRFHGRGWRDFARRTADHLLRRTGWLSFSLLLMITALVLTASRGGVAATLFGIGLATLFAVFFHGKRAAESRLLPRIVLLSFVGMAWLGAGGLFEKLEAVGFSSNRGDIRAATLDIAGDYPLTGSGAGTFRWIFPSYKSDALGGGYYEHAHNDYLELLAEQGLIGAALLAGAVVLIFSRIVSSYARRRDPLARGAQFAAIAGGSALLAHGLVDFNLNIPANAALFFLLLGLGSVAGRLNARSGSQPGVEPYAEPARKQE